ncbi:hypothetical protein [Shewanella maritima]
MVNAIVHVPSPEFTDAIQNTPSVANAVTLPEKVLYPRDEDVHCRNPRAA